MSLQAAFEKAGITAQETRFRIEFRRFIESGGTKEQVLKIADEYFSNAGAVLANARTGGATVTSLSPNAVRDIHKKTAKRLNSIFDRITTRTGQPWGNIVPAQLGGFAPDAALAEAVESILKSGGKLTRKNMNTPIRQLMSAAEFHTALRKSGVKDAA